MRKLSAKSLSSPPGIIAYRKLESRLERVGPRGIDGFILLSGAATTLAFAPFNLFPLGIVMPAVLFASWLHSTPARAAWRGFLFGLGMFGVGISWVYVSLHNFGNMPVLLAALTVLLLTMVLAAFPAMTGYLQARLFGFAGATPMIVAVPALWVLFEWSRSWVLTGFPWLNIGYSQVPGPLGGFAPWLGVYGVTWVSILSATLFVQGLRDRRSAWRLCVPAVVALWVAGWFAGSVEWVRAVDSPVRVALVQGNVPLQIKWRPRHRQAILERYFNLSAKAPDAELVIWPEAAMPAYLDQIDPAYLARLRRESGNRARDFLIGVVERDVDSGEFYNSVVSVGAEPGTYRKRHLVPLGEYLPLKSVLNWLLRYMEIPMSDFSAGAADQAPMQAAGQPIAVSICYEDAFGQEIIRSLPRATMLVNVSEDSWFGDSLAPHQRLQMAQMRAMETGRPVLRASNNGLSAVIDPRGNVLALAPQFVQTVLTVDVQPMQGATPYVRFGNWLIVTIMLGLVVVAWARERASRATRRAG